jgi:hypothetical protein
MDTAIRQRISRRSQVGRFVLHYFEMCLPMCLGFLVGDLAYFWAAGLFGYSEPFSELPVLSVLVVTFSMTAPMTAWMLFRGMPRRAIVEMSAAMPCFGDRAPRFRLVRTRAHGQPDPAGARLDDAGHARPDALPPRSLHRAHRTHFVTARRGSARLPTGRVERLTGAGGGVEPSGTSIGEAPQSGASPSSCLGPGFEPYTLVPRWGPTPL